MESPAVAKKMTGKIIDTSLSQTKTSVAEDEVGGALLVGPIWDTTPRHTSISGTMVFKTPISALEFMFITSCAEASITGPHLTEFFLVDLQVPLIPSWAVISTQKSIKLPSTRTCPCSARSSQSFRIPSKADINVWMSMPQDSPPARSFILTVRTEAERIIRSAISSWVSARWTNEAVSHSPSSRPM